MTAGYSKVGTEPPALQGASTRSTISFTALGSTSPTTLMIACPGVKYDFANDTMSSRLIAFTDCSVTARPYGCASVYKTFGKTRPAMADARSFAWVNATSRRAR